MTEYCSDSLRSYVNTLMLVNDTAGRGIDLIKQIGQGRTTKAILVVST